MVDGGVGPRSLEWFCSVKSTEVTMADLAKTINTHNCCNPLR